MIDETNKTMLIGYKGVKYGLQKHKSAPKLPAFDDSSEDEGVDAQVAREQQKNLNASKVAAARAAAIAEDSTVYEYDAVYDDMQRDREAARRKDVRERKPKYIETLMQKAEIRKKEQDIAYERRLLKERKQDDHLYEHKEAFLTEAYKKKLMENKFWIEREKRMDAREAAEDVTKKRDLSGFYQNLCTRNVAFASNRLAEETSATAPPDPSPLPEQDSSIPAEAEPASSQKQQSPEKSLPEKPQPSGLPSAIPLRSPNLDASDRDAGVPDRGKRRNDAASIASARERYLSRKKQRRTDCTDV